MEFMENAAELGQDKAKRPEPPKDADGNPIVPPEGGRPPMPPKDGCPPEPPKDADGNPIAPPKDGRPSRPPMGKMPHCDGSAKVSQTQSEE